MSDLHESILGPILFRGQKPALATQASGWIKGNTHELALSPVAHRDRVPQTDQAATNAFKPRGRYDRPRHQPVSPSPYQFDPLRLPRRSYFRTSPETVHRPGTTSAPHLP